MQIPAAVHRKIVCHCKKAQQPSQGLYMRIPGVNMDSMRNAITCPQNLHLGKNILYDFICFKRGRSDLQLNLMQGMQFSAFSQGYQKAI